MTDPSPLIVDTLSAHEWIVFDGRCRCGWRGIPPTPHAQHIAQALADAGALSPEQVREREAAVLEQVEREIDAGRHHTLSDPQAAVENDLRIVRRMRIVIRGDS